MKKNLIAFVLIVLAVTPGIAQDPAFVASVDRSTVGATEQFRVSFTLSGADVNSARNFKAPEFGQLVVLSGPSSSTNIQIVNGQISGSLTYAYAVYARTPGKYTIASATVEYRGATLRTQPLQIEVTQASPQQQQATTAPQEAQEIGDNLFIRATADKQRVKQGEPVTITYKLYTRVQVSGYDLSKAPVYQGFWSEEIEQPRQPAVATEMHDGKQYRVAIIRKTALFPTQSGKLTVAPLEVRCAVQLQRRRTNDPFDAFFNDPFFSRLQNVEQNFSSNALTITVDPLPGDAPEGFSGAVGRFTMTATVDHNEVKTGDPVTLKITVSGSGNVKLLTLPKPTLPADVEAYEPKVSEEITRDGGIIRGRKVAEYLLIPRNAGQRFIEPVTFTYYDLERNRYASLHSPRFELTITPGRDVGAGTSIASKSDIRLLGDDIRFIKLSPGDLREIDRLPLSRGMLLLGLVLPPFLFIGAFVYRKRVEKISGNVRKLRFEKAGKEATRRLKQAKKLLAQGNTESYHAEVARALTGYLEDKLHISKASFTIDEALNALERGSVPSETVAGVKSCLERAEYARFAPSADTKASRQELLEGTAQAINAIEKTYSKKT
ncbi:MAG: BatD family protein [Bacteroidota bacterium]